MAPTGKRAGSAGAQSSREAAAEPVDVQERIGTERLYEKGFRGGLGERPCLVGGVDADHVPAGGAEPRFHDDRPAVGLAERRNRGGVRGVRTGRGRNACGGDALAHDQLVPESLQRAAAVRAPAFRAAPDSSVVTEFAREHGYPLIVKPRLGAGSAGIVRLDGPADHAKLPDLAAESHLGPNSVPGALRPIGAPVSNSLTAVKVSAISRSTKSHCWKL